MIEGFDLSPVVIIGTGLVGASIGCALRKAKVSVYLEDLLPAHVDLAVRIGAGSSEPVADAEVKLVIVAVPPAALAQVIAAAIVRFPNAVITDVGSVKATVLTELRAAKVELSRYIGSHPMAGSHETGPKTADGELFVNRTWVVCPHDTVKANAVLLVEKLARLCGARVVTMGPVHHDEAVAQVSHLPHLVSALVARHLNDVPESHLKLAGQGLRDVTRIAGSDPNLWRQIIAANGAAVRNELVELHHDLTALISMIDNQDQVLDFLADAQLGTKALPGKHGQIREEFDLLVVEIPDAKGALSRLFAVFDDLAVNIEDILIEHDDQRAVGWVTIFIARGLAGKVRESLVMQGWKLRR